MKVVQLEDRHLETLVSKGAFGRLTEYTKDPARRQGMLNCKHAFAAEVEGTAIAAAGLLEYWPGRCEVWAVFDPACKPYFLQIHNAVKRFLRVVYVRRIEAIVETDFTAGHRWVKSLGFKMEAERLRSYTVDGLDVSLYVMIKG